MESQVKMLSRVFNSLIENGKISIDGIKAKPSAFSGKSAEEIAEVLKNYGYDVTVTNSTRSTSGARIIRINNLGGEKNISQIQVSPGNGRHGINPYVKISTTDQGIIEIVDGLKSTYITDGKETATLYCIVIKTNSTKGNLTNKNCSIVHSEVVTIKTEQLFI